METVQSKKKSLYKLCTFEKKVLYILDGKKSNLEENDVGRRNTIATLMSDWGLLTVENKEQLQPIAPLRQIKIISFKDKDQWELCPKYNIGNGTK